MFSSRHIETSSSPEHKFVKNLHHKNKIKELLDLSKRKKTKLFRIKSYCKWTLANHPDEKKKFKTNIDEFIKRLSRSENKS